MAKEIFYVKVETAKATSIYAFSRSETGIMDYEGSASPEESQLSEMQCVEGSTYFTPSWYTYLPREMQAEISAYLPASITNLDANQYSFLLHVGALLLAVSRVEDVLRIEVDHQRGLRVKRGGFLCEREGRECAEREEQGEEQRKKSKKFHFTLPFSSEL